MHIGLIGGIGPAATDFYHRGLIERHHAANIPLDLTIAYADVRTMSRNLNEKRPDRQQGTKAQRIPLTKQRQKVLILLNMSPGRVDLICESSSTVKRLPQKRTF